MNMIYAKKAAQPQIRNTKKNKILKSLKQSWVLYLLLLPTLLYVGTDLRCDLHPRWNEDGSMISFDSTHEGQRAVYIIDAEQVKEEFFRF